MPLAIIWWRASGASILDLRGIPFGYQYLNHASTYNLMSPTVPEKKINFFLCELSNSSKAGGENHTLKLNFCRMFCVGRPCSSQPMLWQNSWTMRGYRDGHDFMHIDKKNERNAFFLTPFMPLLKCAQIVPVKVKYFQMVPNETKNRMKNLNRINCL